ncbi:hypothetical protein HRG_014231 [Hirsutella rhossiliensis]
MRKRHGRSKRNRVSDERNKPTHRIRSKQKTASEWKRTIRTRRKYLGTTDDPRPGLRSHLFPEYLGTTPLCTALHLRPGRAPTRSVPGRLTGPRAAACSRFRTYSLRSTALAGVSPKRFPWPGGHDWTGEPREPLSRSTGQIHARPEECREEQDCKRPGQPRLPFRVVTMPSHGIWTVLNPPIQGKNPERSIRPHATDPSPNPKGWNRDVASSDRRGAPQKPRRTQEATGGSDDVHKEQTIMDGPGYYLATQALDPLPVTTLTLVYKIIHSKRHYIEDKPRRAFHHYGHYLRRRCDQGEALGVRSSEAQPVHKTAQHYKRSKCPNTSKSLSHTDTLQTLHRWARDWKEHCLSRRRVDDWRESPSRMNARDSLQSYTHRTGREWVRHKRQGEGTDHARQRGSFRTGGRTRTDLNPARFSSSLLSFFTQAGVSWRTQQPERTGSTPLSRETASRDRTVENSQFFLDPMVGDAHREDCQNPHRILCLLTGAGILFGQKVKGVSSLGSLGRGLGKGDGNPRSGKWLQRDIQRETEERLSVLVLSRAGFILYLLETDSNSDLDSDLDPDSQQSLDLPSAHLKRLSILALLTEARERRRLPTTQQIHAAAHWSGHTIAPARDGFTSLCTYSRLNCPGHRIHLATDRYHQEHSLSVYKIIYSKGYHSEDKPRRAFHDYGHYPRRGCGEAEGRHVKSHTDISSTDCTGVLTERVNTSKGRNNQNTTRWARDWREPFDWRANLDEWNEVNSTEQAARDYSRNEMSARAESDVLAVLHRMEETDFPKEPGHYSDTRGIKPWGGATLALEPETHSENIFYESKSMLTLQRDGCRISLREQRVRVAGTMPALKADFSSQVGSFAGMQPGLPATLPISAEPPRGCYCCHHAACVRLKARQWCRHWFFLRWVVEDYAMPSEMVQRLRACLVGRTFRFCAVRSGTGTYEVLVKVDSKGGLDSPSAFLPDSDEPWLRPGLSHSLQWDARAWMLPLRDDVDRTAGGTVFMVPQSYNYVAIVIRGWFKRARDLYSPVDGSVCRVLAGGWRLSFRQRSVEPNRDLGITSWLSLSKRVSTTRSDGDCTSDHTMVHGERHKTR